MADLPSLEGLSSAQLRALAEDVAARHEAVLAGESAARSAARERVLELVRSLQARLGPEQPSRGNLLSLREAQLMSVDDLSAKPGPAIHLILEVLCDVVGLACESARIDTDLA